MVISEHINMFAVGVEMEYMPIVNTRIVNAHKEYLKKFLGVSVFLQVFISLRHVSVCDIQCALYLPTMHYMKSFVH